MWLSSFQSYQTLTWQHQGDNTIVKQVLLGPMQLSLRMLYSLKPQNAIFLNGQPVKNHDLVQDGDVLSVQLPDEQNEYEAEPVDFSILYEDEDLIAVDKPAWKVVHPTKGHQSATLLHGLVAHFEERDIRSKVRFVNRLDRDTTGLLLVAKNAWAHAVLSSKCALWDIKKEYLALAQGKVAPYGSINLPIGRAQDGIRRHVQADGQSALTHYRCLQALTSGDSLVCCRLHTGRTHQIRVHMQAIGHPLLGDPLYGPEATQALQEGRDPFQAPKDPVGLDRQALHCRHLAFRSPRKEQPISLYAKLPQDMEELLNKLS